MQDKRIKEAKDAVLKAKETRKTMHEAMKKAQDVKEKE